MLTQINELADEKFGKIDKFLTPESQGFTLNKNGVVFNYSPEDLINFNEIKNKYLTVSSPGTLMGSGSAT